MLTTIVIPVLNRIDLLKRCVDSIDHEIDKLIIINNGQETIPAFFNGFIKDTYILYMPSNLGVATSWNLGIKSTPYSDGWIFLNSDAWFNPGALKNYLATVKTNNIQLVSEDVVLPPWCCAWVGSDVVKKVGLFCEGFYPAYYEDWDYERRVIHNGFDVVYSEAEINHEILGTTKSNDNYKLLNMITYPLNRDLYDSRNETADAGHWTLQRRLDLSWDERLS